MTSHRERRPRVARLWAVRHGIDLLGGVGHHLHRSHQLEVPARPERHVVRRPRRLVVRRRHAGITQPADGRTIAAAPSLDVLRARLPGFVRRACLARLLLLRACEEQCRAPQLRHGHGFLEPPELVIAQRRLDQRHLIQRHQREVRRAVDRTRKAKVEQHRIEVVRFHDDGHLDRDVRQARVAALERAAGAEAGQQLGRVARFATLQVELVRQRVPPLERVVHLHEVRDRQRDHRRPDQRVEQEVQLVESRVRRDVGRPYDRHAAPAREDGRHEVGGCRPGARGGDRSSQPRMDDQRCAEREQDRPRHEEVDEDGRPAERQHLVVACIEEPGESLEQPPRRALDVHAQDAGADARVEHREEDIGDDREHHDRPGHHLEHVHLSWFDEGT